MALQVILGACQVQFFLPTRSQFTPMFDGKILYDGSEVTSKLSSLVYKALPTPDLITKIL
jgi:hypothetical protein